jgi:hypothetical protein
MFSARGHWLPGDERGFRDRKHRIHSSGDYAIPPPPDEHAGLRRYAHAIAGPSVRIPEELRSTIARALGEKFDELHAPARIIAITETHAHALVRVGDVDAKPLVGRAKQAASFVVRASLPGQVWGGSCHVVRVRSEDHYRRVVEYIDEHRCEGGAIWVHPSVRQPTGE